MSQDDKTKFKGYLMLWIGQLVSLLGSSVAQFVIIWWMVLETESTLYLSIAYLVGLAPDVVLTPFAGVFADRWNRKALIMIMDFLQASITLVLILLFWFVDVSYWQVLVLLGLRGVFQAFHRPAVRAITPSMVPRDKLSRINGLNFFFTGLINLIGPVVAAFLLEFWKISQILWIDVATFILAIIPLLMVKVPSVKKKQEKRSFKDEFVEGLVFIKKTRGLLPLFMLAAVLILLITPFNTLLPYFIIFDHLGEATDLAFVTMFVQGGFLMGGILTSIIEFKRKGTTTISFLYVLFTGYALVALTPKGLFWIIAIGGFIMVCITSIIIVTVQTTIQAIIPLEMQGRMDSVVMTLAFAATPIGMILSGAIAEFIGTANIFLACSVLGIIIVTASWFFTEIGHIEEMKSPDESKQKTMS